MEERKIHWDKDAVRQLNEAITYIRKDSPQNAEKVKWIMLEKISNLSQNPEVHPTDKYKVDNDGSYRVLKSIITA